MNDGLLHKKLYSVNINLKFNKYNLNFLKIKNIFYFLLRITFFIFFISIVEGKSRNWFCGSSEIHMIIKGTGIQNLLNDSFYIQPYQVYVNNIKKDSCKLFCDMENNKENTVTLIFNDNLNSSESMFFGLNNLIEIDLSDFDFSQVATMENMFRDCYNLKKINFGNIDTSSVVDMKGLFYNCTNLSSIDVSKFDTSKVSTMEEMFYNCQSLSTIDVSNFNTSKVESFRICFYNCYALEYIDISNFNTSIVTNMEAMLYNCSSLLSIDVTNFNTKNVKTIGYLFYNCSKLTKLNVSNFDTSKITNMQFLFFNLSRLESIDLSNFNTKNVESLKGTFYFCQRLIYLDISFFDISKVTDFSYLFNGCNNLKSLNIFKSDTSSAKNMKSLFYNYYNLESLDLTNFDTSSVTDMNFLFYGCYSLKIIKFPEIFNTSKLESMRSMFFDCQSLIFLNLSSFDASKVTDMRTMFNNCHNLKYLDIQNFNPINLRAMNQMFYNMSSLIFLNIDSLEINKQTTKTNSFENLPLDLKICSNKINMQNYLSSISKTYDCSNICFIKDIKIDINKNECIHSSKDNEYNHEYNNICYNECPYDSHIIIKDINNKDNIFIEYEDGVAICLDRNPKGYYLDKDEFYEECHPNCEFCYDKGNEKNNSCTKCKPDLIFLNDIMYNNNCYEKCPNNYYFNENNYICTSDNNCPINYNKFIFNKSKCIDKCESDETFKYEYNNICYEECPEGTILSSKKEYFCFGEENIYEIDILDDEDIHKLIATNILNKYNISYGEEMIYQGENDFFFHVTNTENEIAILEGKMNKTNKFSVIDLRECGILLKRSNNINENSSLIIMKYEKITNISSERSLQYEVYEPYNKKKLNLSICGNINIDIYIPVILSEKTQFLYNELQKLGYDLFDINSPFYNDICTPYISPNGTDVLLSDRINSYYYNDDTSCQFNCKFSDYLMESQYLKCECDIKNSEINTNNAKSFSAKSIYQSFYAVLKYSNYKVLKCAKLIININSLIKNIGSILSIAYFFFFFLFLIIYIFKGINQLKTDFSKIITAHTNGVNSNKIIDKNILVHKNINNKINFKDNKKKQNNKLRNNKNNNQILKNINIKKRTIRKNYPPKKNLFNFKKDRLEGNNLNIFKYSKYNNAILSLSKNSFPNSFTKRELINKNISISKKTAEIKKVHPSKKSKYDNYELNNLEYNLAKKFDKRNFCQIYWSLLKREHLVIFTFITKDDHNITFVKYSRFFFLVCSDMAMNVFFFADETMHKMFLDYGKYNFIQQIPQIIYSTIVSQVIEILICYLSLTETYFYKMKETKDITKAFLMENLSCIKVKLAFFFVLTFLMFVFYWYLITCFCTVYQNTQIAFIKDSISSFVLGIILPFILYIFPSVFRIISLKAKSNIGCVYKFSNIIPFF